MRKAVEVQLSKDLTVVVTEPGARDLAAFFRALPVLAKLDKLDGREEGPIKGLPVAEITDEEMDKVLDLLGRITSGIAIDDLTMFQALRLFEAFKLVIPEDFKDFTPPAQANP